MRKSIVTIVVLSISLAMALVGCRGESRASTPEEFVKEVLTSNSLKVFYANVVDGNTILEEMSDLEKASAKKEIDTYREKIKNDEGEIKVLNSNSDSKYTRVAFYKKGPKPTSEKNMDILYLTQIDGKYKIDFSINGINEIDLITYESQGKRELSDFKIYAKLGKEYNYEFNGLRDKYYSIDMNHISSSSILHGYIKKDSQDGKRLYELLKDGAEIQVTLSISIPEWIEVNRDVFLIEGLKAQGWAVE